MLKVDSRYWLTPPDLYQSLNDEFHFDFDPCPYPRPVNYNSLILPWGKMNYVNPPFRAADGPFGGPTAFVRKAIAEQKIGNSSVLVLPVVSYVDMLAGARADIRSAGRIKWIDARDGQVWKRSGACCIFILKP